MKKFIFLSLAFLFIQICSVKTYPCTGAFCATATLSKIGYNMDWYWLGGAIFTRPSGIEKTSIVSGGQSWTSKYRSIVFSNYSPNLPFGGVNEHGLKVFCLGAPYQIDDSRAGLPEVNELEMISLMLDKAKNVNEAREILESTKVSFFGLPLHYFICDSGKCIVADFAADLRIHETQKGKQVISNEWYDDMLEHKQGDYIEDRRGYSLLKDLKDWPTKVDEALSRVQQGHFSQWYVSIRDKIGGDQRLSFMIRPRWRDPSIVNINLTDMFRNKNFDRQAMWISIGPNRNVEESYYELGDWKPLTEDQEKRTLRFNLKKTLEYEKLLFERNDKPEDAVKNVRKLMKSLSPKKNKQSICSELFAI